MDLPNLNDARVRTNKEIEQIYLNQQYDSNTFKGQKYFLKTYGCQMNVHDSEEIAARLESLGFESTDTIEGADLVIMNTCAIRENAHDKLYGFLGRCKHEKEKNNKDLIIAICGCMAQEENVCNEIMTKHKYVDLVFGTHNIHELQDLILKKNNIQTISVYSKEGEVYENVPYKRDSKIKAWVNIQYGCDKFCTYCIVPYTRGKQRSRRSCEIIKEVNRLIEDGYMEVTLLGQNVNAYGKDLNDISFAELLEEVAKTGIPRVRFVTSHPWDFSDEMIETIAKYENIMPYIHLPLQSGSSRILKLMGRRYTQEEYLTLYNKIKNIIPNVSVTTDIIVGFPNETDEDFEETLKVVNECKYDSAFTFIYSPREGTPAAKMEDSIDIDTKEERLQKLNKLVNKYSLKANKKYIGKTVDVLIEGISEKDPNKMFGYTDTMKLVNVVGAQEKIGKIVKVTITDAKSFSLDGEIS
ncbi:MAG: tRNA (N6-isopentenyl adenosine(37)-C2)-methylthiotransferase MiaB [Candidatus Coprovivens sp.]